MRERPQLNDLNLDSRELHDAIKSTNNESQEFQRLSKPLASPGRRYVGQILDLIVTWVIFLLLLSLFNKIGLTRENNDLISVSIAAIYLFLSDALPRGKSIGKLMLGMSVIDKKNGTYCSICQSFIRNILTPLIGLIDAVFILSKRRQRIGDLAANTIVIKDT
jgi:uncharacterized RDD family membrane protein YckC